MIAAFKGNWFKGIKKGDTKAFRGVLHSIHPGYSKTSKYSKKEMSDIINNTKVR